MKISICLSTFNRPRLLERTLVSIYRQKPDNSFEVIVVDDGSEGTETKQVCRQYPLCYLRIDREPIYRNPAVARNLSYRHARGRVIIAQSDDVIHHTPDTIDRLVNHLLPDNFVLATIYNVNEREQTTNRPHGTGYGDRLSCYVSPWRQRPLFFLGALWRKHLYAVGGNDENFTGPSREDRWFATCLIRGQKLTPFYAADVIGYHQDHPHTTDYEGVRRSQSSYREKQRRVDLGLSGYVSDGGPWEYREERP